MTQQTASAGGEQADCRQESELAAAAASRRNLPKARPHKDRPQGCTHRQVQVTTDQLPLCCPLPGERVWDTHPRVYLVLDDKHAEAICPYCETHYRLAGAEKSQQKGGEKTE